jgi:hypothetical protein
VIPFEKPLVKNASAESSWVQTTEQDFNNGTLTNVTVTPSGEVELALQTKYVEEDFSDESKIGYKENITVNTTIGSAELTKINKTFGGSDYDEGKSVYQTSDGGYIITGNTSSFGGSDQDVLLIKTDSLGNKEWIKTFDRMGFDDTGNSVQETSDSGFIICGTTEIFVWLIKTDSLGNEQWNKVYGNMSFDSEGYSVDQTSDGYIITGGTKQFSATNWDAWWIKVDLGGNKMWDYHLGGSQNDYGMSVQDTGMGFIITGYTFSYGEGLSDVWLIKTEADGSHSWNMTFGGGGSDRGNSVHMSSDGGYIITGLTYSFGGDIPNAWLIKTDSNGNHIWNKTYGWTGGDTGNSGQQTSDGGYILTGLTDSFGAGGFDVLVVKTDSSGNEQWNKTFGGSAWDWGKSIQQTIDGGYIITGLTDSYGLGWDVWLIKINETGCLEFINGELTSENLLVGKEVSSIDTFNCTTSIPFGAEIKVQFSQNNFNWYSSSGTENDWDLFFNGFNSIDLSALGWGWDSYFYYRMSFTSEIINTPNVQNINVSYSQYFYDGTFESEEYDAGASVNWTTMGRTANIIDTSKGFTAINIQIRTATTQVGLAGKNYVGPDGTSSTYYDSPSDNIWSGHGSDQWIQYIANLSTPSGEGSPSLLDVSIFYNHFPSEPVLVYPSDDSFINDNTPEFNWNFNDLDSNQAVFQVLVDDDNSFSSVEYDSGEQSSNNEYWQITSTLAEGVWYWKVKTKDDDGDWGPYSGYNTVTIDITIPDSFIPTASPSGWTSNTQPQISFSTTDGNGIDHYEVNIDSLGFSTQTSPYTIPSQTDGIHNITVRAYDEAGNYFESYVDIYIDTTPPTITHTPVTSGTSGDPITITADITDGGSGIANVRLYYKKSSESTYTELQMSAVGDTYSAQIPGNAVTSPGLEYYIKAEDNIDPRNIDYYGGSGQTVAQPTSLNDIDISIPVIDTTPPSISTHTPTGTNVPIDSTITVTFNEDMNQSATQSAFSILPDVSGSYSWSGNQLVFTPSSDLDYGSTYNVTMGTGAEDLVGNNLELFSWEFTTIPSIVTAPEVDKWEPTGTDVSVKNVQIRVDFTEDMNSQTTEAAVSIEPEIEFGYDWNGKDEIIIIPLDPLKYDTKYTVYISTNATDMDGEHLQENFTWYFFTEKGKEEGFDWNTWEPIITGVTILASMLIALFGFIQLRKRRSRLHQYLEKIDETYDEYKEDPDECKKELLSLREKIKIEVKHGHLEEGHFLVLDKKIDDYLMEIKEMKKEAVKSDQIEDISETISEEEVGEKIGEGEQEE